MYGFMMRTGFIMRTGFMTYTVVLELLKNKSEITTGKALPELLDEFKDAVLYFHLLRISVDATSSF